jgi:cell division septation protein DedD
MPVHAWFESLKAQNHELKLASGMALASVIIILLLVFWSLFITNEQTADIPEFTQSAAVQTIEPPKLAVQQPIKAKQHQASAKQQPQSKPKIKTKQHKTSTVKNKIILGQGNYYLQVGAFKQAGLARLMLEKMKKKYQYAKIKQKADKYAVWVGPVVSKGDALKLQKYVQRKDNIKGFITVEK